MKTYIALLRGINVSGQKKVPMAELREILSKLNIQNVQTYIQSGNVLFKSSIENIEHLELDIHNAIKNKFGFEVPVLVRTRNVFQSIFDACPFPEDKKQSSYFTILHSPPNKDLIASVSKETYENEAFFITNNCVYFHCSTGYGKAKCNNNFFERKLKVSATTRNYKTMVKLLSLSADLQ